MEKIRTLISVLITTLVLSFINVVFLKISNEKLCNENSLKYANEIDNYEDFLEEYAGYIKSLN